MKNFLDYEVLVENALLGVLKSALAYVQNKGLPGDHHFYITFKTKAKGVIVPEFLSKKHPETITIVLQYEFSDLLVLKDRFEVTLSFNNKNHHIIVPFNSVIAFSDPSVKFSLQFNLIEETENLELFESNDIDVNNKDFYEDTSEKIISLDAFRKKLKKTEE